MLESSPCLSYIATFQKGILHEHSFQCTLHFDISNATLECVIL